MIKGRKKSYVYISYCVCYSFLIFKFIIIYLLHVLFVLKIENVFLKKKKSTQKSWSLYI